MAKVHICARRAFEERGFTMVEFMISAAIMAAVLGGTVMLATQLQQTYSTQLDDVTVEEEARFALDWIARTVRSAGSNPYSIALSACPIANTVFQGIRLDPNGNGIDDDIRVQADVNPPNGLLGGLIGVCAEEEEDITIAHDSANSTITRQDNSVDLAAVAMTEPIFTDLRFTYLDAARAVTADVNVITYVRVRVTGRSLAHSSQLGDNTEVALETEVRLRTR